MKHKHYQEIQAYANCWEIELKTESGVWIGAANPCFYGHRQYRIVPDAEGWIPFYAHEDSECPVDPEQMVWCSHFNRLIFSDAIYKAGDLDWSDKERTDFIITRYRLVQEADTDYSDIDDLVDDIHDDQHRVKPKTRKLWQWIIKDKSVPEEPYYYLTEMFYATRDELEEFLVTRDEVLQKANWTMIEVEE